MGRREEPAWAKGTVGLAMARERGDIRRQFQEKLTVTRETIDRLGLETTLDGHVGCVNCLEWNTDGSVLASASDDLHVILWDPYRYKKLHRITTGHTGNIFSVKFLTPDTIATCAADEQVRTRSVTSGAVLRECSCHSGRVKRLAVAPGDPHMIWSAAEDGFILQHDTRMPHTCKSESSNVLVNLLKHLGRFAEAKSVAVNPRRPNLIAVGANDFYVRLYDTRMIKMAKQQWHRQNLRPSGDFDSYVLRNAARYFGPGHLCIEPNELFPKKAATYVAFSNDGNELLVNLGSEQVYLFDINSTRSSKLVESFIIRHNHGAREQAGKGARPEPRHGANGTVPAPEPAPQLPERIQQLKELAKDHAAKNDFAGAIHLYSRAIGEWPAGAVLYTNRAAALMRRAWTGDTYAAIKDCYRAIELDPNHVKSHFRLAKGLMDLNRAREAHECLLYFKDKFPKHATSHAVFLLQKDINEALEGMNDQPEPDEVPEVIVDINDVQTISVLERQLRTAAIDYSQRFVGHCNTTTDIKEANFLGPDASFIAAGSDDGSLFIWERKSGNIVRCLRGDSSIVNCVQMHPSQFLLATSGIEAVVRLWSPRPEDGKEESRVITDMKGAAFANQQRMRSDPFEALLLNISFAGGPERDPHSPACRPT